MDVSDLRFERVPLRWVVPIRWATLRPGEPDPSWCVYPGDYEAVSQHIRVLAGGVVTGVVSLIRDSHTFEGGTQAHTRVRGLGVVKSFRGRGIGEAVLKHSLDLMQAHDLFPAWGSGRSELQHLYLRLGATVVSETYEIRGTGDHLDFLITGIDR